MLNLRIEGTYGDAECARLRLMSDNAQTGNGSPPGARLPVMYRVAAKKQSVEYVDLCRLHIPGETHIKSTVRLTSISKVPSCP